MLRILQDQSFERVGGNEAIRTDVRLISATQRDLKAWSDEGRFRPDLYYRLSVFTIHLPPLRERGDDLRLLVRYYLRRFGRELGRDVHEIDPEALRLLHSYSWPGNIRELQSVLKQAILQSRGSTLLPGSLPPLLGTATGPAPSAQATAGDPGLEAFIGRCLASMESDLYAEAHRQVDRVLLARTLEGTGGNQLRAARWLGIGRETLRRRIREVGIHVNHWVEAEPED
jgi:DNA-binding NtrC family response regulator